MDDSTTKKLTVRNDSTKGVQASDSHRALTPKQAAFVSENKISVDRFWVKIDSSGGDDSCWNWMGCKDGKGYGRFHIGKRRGSSMLAHRVSYGIATGESPEAVCHKCDNPSCCNPKHLFGGTRDDNNKDMNDKGRHWLHGDKSLAVKGENHGSAKLIDGQIIEIRNKYKAGGVTQRDLAKEFCVSQRTICKIVNLIGWTHLEPPAV